MASRKSVWDGMDALEGKKVGSSHAALNKERVRQGYKKEGHHPQKMPKGLVSKAQHEALRERLKGNK